MRKEKMWSFSLFGLLELLKKVGGIFYSLREMLGGSILTKYYCLTQEYMLK